MLSENPNNYAVGVDVGGSHLSSAVVDLETARVVTPVEVTPVDSKASALEIINAWQTNILSTLDIFPIGVAGIGMAIPGPFDYENGVSTIHGVSKYEQIFGLDVRNTLPSFIGTVTAGNFRFLNDASAFALGECFGGAAKGCERVVALTLGTGVGSGFVASGKLVSSGNDVPMNGWVYHLPFENGIADEAFSTRWFIRKWKETSGETVNGVKEIADLCPADHRATELFESYGKRLAEFTLPLLRRFNSNTLLLGGNIAKAYNHFGNSLETHLALSDLNVSVKLSSLSDKAALVGAASLFKTNM